MRSNTGWMGLVLLALVAHGEARAGSFDVTESSVPARAIAAIERDIAGLATLAANEQQFFDDDVRPIQVSARYDAAQEVLYLDLGKKLGKVSACPGMKDLQSHVLLVVANVLKDLPGYRYTEWRYGGGEPPSRTP
jgi:hypothetical protein